jgi:hypothetical protein
VKIWLNEVLLGAYCPVKSAMIKATRKATTNNAIHHGMLMDATWSAKNFLIERRGSARDDCHSPLRYLRRNTLTTARTMPNSKNPQTCPVKRD